MIGSENKRPDYFRGGKPQKADRILEMALKRSGLDKQIERYRFVSFWKEIVGEEIAKRTKPERLAGPILMVTVSSSVWAQELSFQKKALITRVNRFLGGRKVTDMRFIVGEL